MEIRNEGANVVRNVLQENKICVVTRRFYVQESLISGTTFVRTTMCQNVTLSILYTLTLLFRSYLRVKCPKICEHYNTNTIANKFAYK
jgi:uncharacterized membrane protein YeiH